MHRQARCCEPPSNIWLIGFVIFQNYRRVWTYNVHHLTNQTYYPVVSEHALDKAQSSLGSQPIRCDTEIQLTSSHTISSSSSRNLSRKLVWDQPTQLMWLDMDPTWFHRIIWIRQHSIQYPMTSLSLSLSHWGQWAGCFQVGNQFK